MKEARNIGIAPGSILNRYSSGIELSLYETVGSSWRAWFDMFEGLVATSRSRFSTRDERGTEREGFSHYEATGVVFSLKGTLERLAVIVLESAEVHRPVGGSDRID